MTCVVEMGDQFLSGLFDRMLKGVVEKSRDSSRWVVRRRQEMAFRGDLGGKQSQNIDY